MTDFNRFKVDISDFLDACTEEDKTLFLAQVGIEFSKPKFAQNDKDREEILLPQLLKATGIKHISTFSRLLKAYRNREGRTDLIPAIGLYFLAKVDDDYGTAAKPIEQSLFGENNKNPITFLDKFEWIPNKIKIYDEGFFVKPVIRSEKDHIIPSNESASKQEFLGVEVLQSNNSHDPKRDQPIQTGQRAETAHIIPIPYSPSYGLRLRVVEVQENSQPEECFSIKASENILFGHDDDLDTLLKRLAEIVSNQNITAEVAKEAFKSMDKKLSGHRAAVKNFLGIDRPILTEFNDVTMSAIPNRQKQSFQRLSAAGVDLTDLSKVGKVLLQHASTYFLDRRGSQGEVRIVFQLGKKERAKEFAKTLKKSIPANLVHLFEFVIIVLSQSENEKDEADLIRNLEEHYFFALLKLLESKLDEAATGHAVSKAQIANYFDLIPLKFRDVYHAAFLRFWDFSQSQTDTKNFEQISCSLVRNNSFCERYCQFVFHRDFRNLDSLIVEFARQDCNERTYLLNALQSLCDNHSHHELEFLSEIRSRIEFLELVQLDQLPAQMAISFVGDYMESPLVDCINATSNAHYLMAYFQFREGQYVQAAKYCERSLHHNPQNYAAQCFLGLMQFRDGDHEQALVSLQNARINSQQEYEFAHFYEGIVLEELSELEDAKEAYVRSLLLRPNFYEAAHNLCNCLIADGRILDASRLASAQITKYGALTPEFSAALAFGLVSSGYSKDARELLLKAHQETRAPIIEYNIAVLYFNRGQSEMCNEWLERLRVNPMSPKFIIASASALKQRKDIPELDESTLLEIQNDETIDPMLGVLFDKHYSGDLFSNYHFVTKVRSALDRHPRHPTHHMPKAQRKIAEAALTLEQKEARKEQRQKYADAIKRGRLKQEPKPVGRKRRKKTQTMNRGRTASMLLAPSYSGG